MHLSVFLKFKWALDVGKGNVNVKTKHVQLNTVWTNNRFCTKQLHTLTLGSVRYYSCYLLRVVLSQCQSKVAVPQKGWQKFQAIFHDTTQASNGKVGSFNALLYCHSRNVSACGANTAAAVEKSSTTTEHYRVDEWSCMMEQVKALLTQEPFQEHL